MAAPHVPRASFIEEQVPRDGAHLRRSLVLVTGRKLLLADDSATIQKVVDLTFSDEGLEVITVSDGRRAIEMLEEVVPDIVLADVFMPGLNGYEVCEHIKRSERFRHIPVMLLVGSFEPFDEAEARRVGADDHLTKPFLSIRTLIGKVGNLLSGGNASSEEATTRKLAPPPEAEKENRPDSGFIERSTADTAPLPPHEREEFERITSSNSQEVSFSDLSMDDQMIEATPADDYSGGGSDHSEHEAEPQQTRQTAQYSATDLKDAGIGQAPESESALPPRETPAPAAVAAQTEDSFSLSDEPAIQPPPNSREASLAASEDSLLDLGDLDTPQALSEADDFFLDLLDEAPAGQTQTVSAAPQPVQRQEHQGEAPAPSVSGTSVTAEQQDAAARVDYEERAAEAVAPQAQEEYAGAGTSGEERRSDEVAPAAQYQAGEVTLDSPGAGYSIEMQTAPTERLPGISSVKSAPTVDDAQSGADAASVSPSGSEITLKQLSPEVIDAIARRAVEQLSERVVEQIAWEVVPQIAELLVKRRLDEEKKNNQ
jgi:CheY-like chemotaxis protein